MRWFYQIKIAAGVLAFTTGLAAVAGTAAGNSGDATTPDSPPDSLVTLFEASGGRRTPRYAETVAYAERLAAAFPALTYTTFGLSAQGRPLPLLVANRDGTADPDAAAVDRERVVVLVQACIHAGECCGKDAGLLLLRDLALSGWPEDLLEHLTVLFVPIFNVDGHERFGPFQRINQIGPDETGWRVTATNLNLNRDFLKADTVELRAWLALWNTWRPDFLVDIHATDGADYQYSLTWKMELQGNMDAGLTDWSDQLLGDLEAELAASGVLATEYVWFRRWGDPTSGLKNVPAEPRFSQGYAAIRNRPGLLVETHMLKPYAERVAATRVLLDRLWRRLAQDAAALQRLVRDADRHAASPAFRAEPFPLRFALLDEAEPFVFHGVAFEEVVSEITGGAYFSYHPELPRTSTLERYARVEPAVSVTLPAAYLVPPEWDDVLVRLAAHGVVFQRLAQPATLTVRTYRFADASWQERPYEGRHPVTFTVEPLTETRTFPAGTAVVGTDQSAARVVAHALEPQGPDSFAAWGLFDAVFTPVEYVEPRVIEAMIPQLLADDLDLRERFETRKADDPEFAGDPRAIREWFYRQTPYADARAGIYPVGLVDDPAAVDRLRGR